MTAESEKDKLHEWLKGRALLEEEVWWMVHSLTHNSHLFERVEIERLIEQLTAEGKIERKQGVERVRQQEGGGEGILPFFYSLCRKWQQLREGDAASSVYVCNRCGASGDWIHEVYCHRCQGLCGYCRRCLSMGRSSCCAPYYLIPAGTDRERVSSSGTAVSSVLAQYPSLTPAQRTAAERTLDFYEAGTGAGDEFLVWAVCGAGKTEVMFPLLHHVLSRGESILWATPRRDVVLELGPRLKKAFPSCEVSVLYGKSPEKWSAAPLVVATTHQALRFYRRFDVVIIDEVDAFPYTADEMLPFAVHRARKLPGKTVYLTATPRACHLSAMKKPHHHSLYLPHEKIPVRYHGHRLPVPTMHRERNLNDRLTAKKPIYTLVQFFEHLKETDSPAFVFVPAIRMLPVMKSYLVALDKEWEGKVETVHASDPEREEKVMAMREGKVRILLTTTIMERGVTIPRISVFVCCADAPVFDEAALVQIAGRAGRSAAFPDGEVVFVGKEKTPAMKAAVRQIEEMNRLAEKAGYV
ncbi:DEAD/DEAH box helicase [Aneurinibacillus tyrosinisolvens]|uniref:DEAD/DEAH box helicase n=1 Tax=Aneurinibacillus tyrosinisolvens TaxID=1443435 RepID=UPI00069A457C|nr:helicase-related protein [Aneurinibacillus tyrosinisolvens]